MKRYGPALLGDSRVTVYQKQLSYQRKWWYVLLLKNSLVSSSAACLASFSGAQESKGLGEIHIKCGGRLVLCSLTNNSSEQSWKVPSSSPRVPSSEGRESRGSEGPGLGRVSVFSIPEAPITHGATWGKFLHSASRVPCKTHHMRHKGRECAQCSCGTWQMLNEQWLGVLHNRPSFIDGLSQGGCKVLPQGSRKVWTRLVRAKCWTRLPSSRWVSGC